MKDIHIVSIEIIGKFTDGSYHQIWIDKDMDGLILNMIAGRNGSIRVNPDPISVIEFENPTVIQEDPGHGSN